MKHFRNLMFKDVLASGVVFLSLSSNGVVAAPTPHQVHTAESRKTGFYVKDGLIAGGDRGITQVIVKDIRRATNADFERVVIDLEGNIQGEPTPIKRASYYQIAVSPDEKRIVLTFWGNPKLNFDAGRVAAAFKKSQFVSGVEILPRLDDDTWTIALELRETVPVEVFELTNPVRVIMDLKGARLANAHAKTTKHNKRTKARAH